MSSGPASFFQSILSRRPNWADLRPRLISAGILLVISAIALFSGGYVFAFAIGVAFALAFREWEMMISRRPLDWQGWALVAALALTGLAYPAFGPLGSAIVLLLAAAFALFWRQPEWPWRVGGLLVFGLVVMGAIAMRGTTDAGIAVGIFLCVVIFITDSGAFFTGRQVGGEKLAPDISPSKTWSGALGGLILGTLGGTIVWPFMSQAPWWLGLLLALGLSITGQLGDLVESAVKRRFSIKDSSDMIPGHGGLMDRLDSLSFGIAFVCVVGWVGGGYGEVASGFLNW